MKKVILCADDYGQAPHISEGIIDLVAKKRLSAVSCLSNFAYWPTHSSWLIPYHQKIDIGLHLNLTEGKALSCAWQTRYGEQFFNLRQLIARAFFRNLDRNIVRIELETQLQHFKACLGFGPAFLDGHQHIHQLPIIREALLQIYEKHLRTSQAYIRWVGDKPKDWRNFDLLKTNLKKTIIYTLGSASLGKALRQQNIPHNKNFAGIYAFSKGEYRSWFCAYLQEIGENGLIMCHPGKAAPPTSGDPIGTFRQKEYAYLASEDFLQDCGQFQIALSGFYDRSLSLRE